MPHDSPLDRRTFMRRIAGVSVGAVATRAPLGLASWNTLHPNYFAVAAEPRALDALRIGLVAVASSSARETDIASFRDGAELGIEKSSRAATLLNKRLEVAPWSADLGTAVDLVSGGAVTVVIAPRTQPPSPN